VCISTTEFSRRGDVADDQPAASTKDGDPMKSAEEPDGDKRSSVSWLMATTLRMCKADPASCFRGRVGRSQRKPLATSLTPLGLQQHLILSSLLE